MNLLRFKSRLFCVFLIFVLVLVPTFVGAQSSAFGSPISTSSYEVSRSKVDREVSEGNIFSDFLEISNFLDREISVTVTPSDSVSDLIIMNRSSASISANNKTRIAFSVVGKSKGTYTGTLNVGGDISETISVNLSVVGEESKTPIIIDSKLTKDSFTLDEDIEFRLDVQKLKQNEVKNAIFNYTLLDGANNKSYVLGSDVLNISNSFQIIKTFKVPEGALQGNYILLTQLNYNHNLVESKSLMNLRVAFLKIQLFGFLPMWLLIVLLSILFVGAITYYFIRRYIQKRKKYQMELDLKTIPSKTPGFFYLGKIAETNHPTYFDPFKLKTHSIVAGATGGGKSISAQVIIEEALLNKVAVIVFDPTAQWSGMLRKNTDKKMFSFYPRFGLKEADAKAFKGNVREVKNEREYIDVKKHINPGQIQVFTLNKLQPEKMDIFVANVIRNIFKSDPQEEADLKLILVFDEVHRLLSKFGGSGEGFLQIERACREFRKWGMGVMLVSQVLADFVGEIKANIATEVQMRTRDEGDLKRIETKYGETFLQSLVKASVGVGMVVNPAYNHGKPYFVNFRPILHNTKRLSDEELEKYNKYNEMLDDLEYQIKQLEEKKIDVFDFNMELKLMKDKLMSGNFSVVEIYMEGLKPRLEKEFQKLGITPKKYEIKLVSEEEIQKSIEEARSSRAAAEASAKKQEGAKEGGAAEEKPEEKKS